MVGFTLNLISGTHHSCEMRDYAFIIFLEYTIISLILENLSLPCVCLFLKKKKLKKKKFVEWSKGRGLSDYGSCLSFSLVFPIRTRLIKWSISAAANNTVCLFFFWQLSTCNAVCWDIATYTWEQNPQFIEKPLALATLKASKPLWKQTNIERTNHSHQSLSL